MTQPFKVWDSERNSMSRYIPYDCYKITVQYPETYRTLEFVGMDRGSCIMQAEQAKETADTVMWMQQEETVTLLKKETV